MSGIEIPLFAGLSESEKADLLRNFFDTRQFLPGEPIVLKGEESKELFLILDGEATVMVDTDVQTVLGRYSIIGDCGLVRGKPRNAKVVAKTDMHVAVMNRENFTALRQKNPRVMIILLLNMMDMAGERTAKQNQLIHQLMGKIRSLQSQEDSLSRDSREQVSLLDRLKEIARIQIF